MKFCQIFLLYIQIFLQTRFAGLRRNLDSGWIEGELGWSECKLGWISGEFRLNWDECLTEKVLDLFLSFSFDLSYSIKYFPSSYGQQLVLDTTDSSFCSPGYEINITVVMGWGWWCWLGRGLLDQGNWITQPVELELWLSYDLQKNIKSSFLLLKH